MRRNNVGTEQCFQGHQQSKSRQVIEVIVIIMI